MFELIRAGLIVIFWLAAAGIAYTYFIYPLLLWAVVSRKIGVGNDAPAAPGDVLQADLPQVAVIVAAFNEEKDIEQRIHNLLSQDYPEHLIQIFVGSDGSSDGTNQILESFRSNPRVTLAVFEENRGKASVLNDLVKLATQPILVFTDANTEFESDNIAKLVKRFAPGVGGVCGELQIYSPERQNADNKDSLYWQYERFLKRLEGHLKCLPGANGANYAIRRELYRPLPAATIVDDFVIGCEVVLAGWDLIYAPEAIAKEEQAPDVKGEFKRRVRIGSGNYQALGWLGAKIRSHTARFNFVFISHKLLRWFVPHMLVLCFVTSAVLSTQSYWFLWIFLLQVAGYAICALVYLTQGKLRWPGPINVLYFLITMNLALAFGYYRYVLGAARPTWQRTER